MKKIIFIISVFIIVFIIYIYNINNKVYYVSLGDQISYGINNENKVENSYSDNISKYHKKNLINYVNASSINDYRVMDLLNDIKYNKIIKYNNKEYKMQNLLIKSNIITISIGMNDLLYKKNTNDLSYKYVDELLIDMEDLLVLIRRFNKDKIYFLSFYDIIENEELINYANKRLKNMCKKNNIKYVDISLLNNYIDNTYPTNVGYKYITNKIINFTK